jgi:DNA-binding LacI/PurR family transcriptional regulator
MPFVFVDMEMDSVPANFVGADNVSCGYMATEHLIKLGHKRILFLQGYHDSATSWRREEGYRKALANYGLPLCPELIVQSNFRFEDGVKAIGEALERKLAFSGAVCASDNIAAGAIAELRTRGIGVPSELSVIGCANLEFASLITPKLSTIDQKAQEIGRAAAETMLKLLDDEDKTRIRSVLIKPELIVRESSAAPKS